MKNKFSLLIMFLLVSTIASAQDVEMADKFRSDGKIYVVLAVLFLIFSGVVGYLINAEIRLRKLEKEYK